MRKPRFDAPNYWYRWLAADNTNATPTDGINVTLYDDRGFRIRIHEKVTTENPRGEFQLTLAGAETFNKDNECWDDWAPIDSQSQETVGGMFVCILSWAQQIGEYDWRSTANVAAQASKPPYSPDTSQQFPGQKTPNGGREG